MPPEFLAHCKFMDIGGRYWPEKGNGWCRMIRCAIFHVPAAPVETFARDLSGADLTVLLPHKFLYLL